MPEDEHGRKLAQYQVVPQAIENAARIAEQCQVDLALDQTFLPRYQVLAGHTLESYLEQLARDGLDRRIAEAAAQAVGGVDQAEVAALELLVAELDDRAGARGRIQRVGLVDEAEVDAGARAGLGAEEAAVGAQVVADAVTAGVAAIAWDSSTAAAPATEVGVPMIAVPNLAAHVGEIANRFFGRPSEQMQVVGVTGTNGKTTVAWLVAQCCEILGERCGYVGTLGTGVGEVAGFQLGRASVDIGPNKVRFEFDGAAEVRQRRRITLQVFVGQTPIVEGDEETGVE